MDEKLEKPFRRPRREPHYVCQKCGWRCWITEEGYAGGHDTEPINCKNCGHHVADLDTTGYVKEKWEPPAT
jgi:hypothetical protein